MASPWKAERVRSSTTTIFAEMSALAAATNSVNLGQGFPDTDGPDFMLAEARAAIAAGVNQYPPGRGTPALRESVAAWFARRRSVPGLDPDGVLPTIGSKELVAWLPTLLGLGSGDVVVHPQVAYPTYDVGARLAGATPKVVDGLAALGPLTPSTTPKLLWLNSPSNPTGRVLGVEHLAKVVAWARQHGVVVASDECYAELDWREDSTEPTTPSILDPRVTGGSHQGLLAVYSLSKQSNLAGYRCAFLAGDPDLVGELLAVRKNLGLQMPGPQQRAMIAALDDDAHVDAQLATYAARRLLLKDALEAAGFRIDHSEASLYLWATLGEDCWQTVAALAEQGILVAPGEFYGPTGRQHVRVAFTATDERVAAAVARLSA